MLTKWFKGHLHWTLVIIFLIGPIIGIIMEVSGSINSSFWPFIFIVWYIGYIAIVIWVGKQKKRSMLTILIWPFCKSKLQLDEESNIREKMSKLNDSWVSEEEKEQIKADLKRKDAD